MADEEEKENSPKGNEWEVVTLTASAYSAAPGPERVDPDSTQGSPDKLDPNHDEAVTSSPMFMSGHFDFPPSQHENLPLEPEFVDSQFDRGGRVESEVKEDHNTTFEAVVPEGFPEISNLSDKDVTFDNAHDTYSSEGEQTDDSDEPFDSDLGPHDIRKPVEQEERDGDGLPCEAWWKRRALSVYAHAKEANTFWSVFIAAAIMGLIVIGHRWQQESWKVFHLKCQFGINNERVGRMLGPLTRFKDVIVGGHRRGSLVRGGTSTEL